MAVVNLADRVMQTVNGIREEVERETAILNDVNDVLSKYGLAIAMYDFEGEGGFVELYLDKLIGK